MTALAFTSSQDSHGRHDASGAFVPEARAWARSYSEEHGGVAAHVFEVDCINMIPFKRRRMVTTTIHDRCLDSPLSMLAFFGHGWPDGIQFGFDRRNIGDLVDIIGLRFAVPFRCVLYTCLTAEDGDGVSGEEIGPGTYGGFADTLRDSLARAGVQQGHVDAHKTAGHATMNPYVVRFDLAKGPGIGGEWLVAPGSENWNRWVHLLRETDLRWRYPEMKREQIVDELTDVIG
jgi:hypothetical protein